MNFGEALKEMKAGKRACRFGWNGKGMFTYYVPAAAYPAQTGVAKVFFGEDALVPPRASTSAGSASAPQTCRPG